MSITQNSNNKPSGFVGRECDAGTPISGKTDSNIYQILKVNNDGTLPLNNYVGGVLISQPNYTVTAVGALGNNTFIGKSFCGVLNGGTYKINPTFIYQGTVAGAISFILYQQNSALDNYVSGLTEGNTFSAGFNDLNNGLYGYWHDSAVQNFGGGLSIAYNRNNTLEVNLQTGAYFVAMVSNASVTISVVGGHFGCYELVKI